MEDEPTIKRVPPLTERTTAPLPVHEAPVRRTEDIPTIRLTAPKSSRRRRSRRGRVLMMLLTLISLLFVLAAALVGYGYYYYTSNIQRPLQSIIHPVSRSKAEPTLLPTPTQNIFASDSTIAGQSWNILLLGSDDDSKYSFPDILTQVMMVVHVDPLNNSVTMVSIPRDSWVVVPGFSGMHKIDQAFYLGASQNNSFDDGVRLARLTIEKDYGITIDRYAWVGLSGFAKVIDTLGGVDINVIHPVLDDVYPNDTGNSINPYNYQRLYIAPGPQHLDGQQALEYVRSRHSDLIGDIGRTERQQQVLEALKLKLNVVNVVANLPQLLNDLNGSVYTDVSEAEMIGFASFAHSLSSSNIHQITLGPGVGAQNYGTETSVYDPTTGSDQDVIIPNCATIQPVINQIFGLGDAQSCNVTGQ
jgi:LCP family protein required for cell wall assembly